MADLVIQQILLILIIDFIKSLKFRGSLVAGSCFQEHFKCGIDQDDCEEILNMSKLEKCLLKKLVNFELHVFYFLKL